VDCDRSVELLEVRERPERHRAERHLQAEQRPARRDDGSDARGKLTMIYTNQGGSDLKLTIDVGRVEFTTESLFSPMPRGSSVCNAAADMKEGECVDFSATNLAPASFLERAQVCDLEYFAVFTSLAPCR
jgi:hypothetical protein